MLTENQKKFYEDEGYLLVEDVINPDQLQDLLNVTDRLIKNSKTLIESNEIYDLDDGHKINSPRLTRIKQPHQVDKIFFDIIKNSKIVDILRSRKIFAPVIGFPFKAGASIVKYSCESKVDCIALDWSVDLCWAIKNLNKDVVLQGNLDPASLIPSHSEHLSENVLTILDIMKDRRFIFNVGHGLTPDCKIDNVKKVISIVRNYKMKA